MRSTLTVVALALALFSPGVLAQPAWGPVYQWGRSDALTGKPQGYFKQVSTGYDYTIGLRPNGSVEVWGVPSGGLGWDDVLDNLPAAGTWLKVEAGYLEGIALHTDGTVYVWGTHITDPPFDPYYCEGDEVTLDDCQGCVFSDVAAGENIMVGIVAGPTTGVHYGDLFVWGGWACFDPRSLSDNGYIDCGASPFVKVSSAGHHVMAKKASGVLVAIGNPVGDPTTKSARIAVSRLRCSIRANTRPPRTSSIGGGSRPRRRSSASAPAMATALFGSPRTGCTAGGSTRTVRRA